jgi:hypothetical protein
VWGKARSAERPNAHIRRRKVRAAEEKASYDGSPIMHAVSGMRSAVNFAFNLVLTPLRAPLFPVFPAVLVCLVLAMGASACAAGAPPPPMPPPEYEDTTPSTAPAIGLGLGADADANTAKPGLTHGDLR